MNNVVCRVLLADDDALVRRSLRTLIEADPALRVVGEATDGAEAAALYLSLKPDIALLDIRMQPVDGLEGGARILSADRKARVLFLTTFADDEYIIRALRMGASGYILKHRFENLNAALLAVRDGQNVFGDDVVERLPTLIRTKPAESAGSDGKRLGDLRERELELVRLVAEGLSNREIAGRLYLSEGTVRNQLSAILDKLDLRDRTQLAILFYRQIGGARSDRT